MKFLQSLIPAPVSGSTGYKQSEHEFCSEAIKAVNELLAEGTIGAFKPPFRVNGNYVDDAMGTTVCEMGSSRTALKDIAAALNAFVKPKSSSKAEVKSIEEQKISEIDYSDFLNSSNFSEKKLIDMAEKDGEIEGTPVFLAKSGNQSAYFLVDNDKITAFIGFEDGHLRNVKNFTNTVGAVRALIGYLVHKRGKTLSILSTEPLTPDGFKWIAHLVKNPRGLVIKDQDGKDINIDELSDEWKNAKRTGKSGNTSITISEDSEFGDKLRLNEQKREKDSILMVHNFYDTNGVGKGSDLECPSCHSLDVKMYSDGEKECHDCHKTWNIKEQAMPKVPFPKKPGEKLFRITSAKHKAYQDIYAKDEKEALSKVTGTDSGMAYRGNDTTVELVEESDLNDVSIKGMQDRKTAEELQVGDVVEITGNVFHKGQTGEIEAFGDGKKFVIVNLYNSGKKSFHTSDVSEADLEHEQDEDEDEVDTFYVAFHDEDEDASWIGKVTQADHTKWREHPFMGDADARWGASYMSYLTPDEVMTWIRKDYSRGMEIEGPFLTSKEAVEYVEREWGPMASKSSTDEEHGVEEAAKWRSDDLEGKTWRSADWDDGDMSPGKIQIGRDKKDVDDSGDELTARPGAWRGKSDMAKRMTKKGVPTKSELAFQNNLKMRMRMQNKQGGLAGPGSKLPEEQGVAEGSDPNTQSHADAFKSETDTMKPSTKKYVGRKDGKEVFAKKDAQGNVKFYHRDGIKGQLTGVTEMDNRTPSGDRREQRAYSPEETARREKELQANLKKVSPLLRKKLRLPEPKEGVAEGQDKYGSKLPTLVSTAGAFKLMCDGKNFILRADSKRLAKMSHSDWDHIADAVKNRTTVTVDGYVLQQKGDSYLLLDTAGKELAYITAPDMDKLIADAAKYMDSMTVKEESSLIKTINNKR